MNKKQISYLKKYAQNLDPIVYIGKAGLSEHVISAVDAALNDHELVKIRFVDYKDAKSELSSQICDRVDSTLINLIGNTAVIFRQNQQQEKRKIRVPNNF
ncbi:MAG: YhbY family RNA-binding protein [Spirochaetales bacterium]|nr:YhbY family RNA-binding protein [Spirochaetales bacterium]